MFIRAHCLLDKVISAFFWTTFCRYIRLAVSVWNISIRCSLPRCILLTCVKTVTNLSGVVHNFLSACLVRWPLNTRFWSVLRWIGEFEEEEKVGLSKKSICHFLCNNFWVFSCLRFVDSHWRYSKNEEKRDDNRERVHLKSLRKRNKVSLFPAVLYWSQWAGLWNSWISRLKTGAEPLFLYYSARFLLFWKYFSHVTMIQTILYNEGAIGIWNSWQINYDLNFIKLKIKVMQVHFTRKSSNITKESK